MSECKLTISRGVGFFDFFRRYRIILDGKSKGSIGRNQTVEIPVNSGKHQLRVAIDWFGSELITFSIAAGERIRFVCGNNVRGLNFLRLAGIFLGQGVKYLWLVRANGSDGDVRQYAPKVTAVEWVCTSIFVIALLGCNAAWAFVLVMFGNPKFTGLAHSLLMPVVAATMWLWVFSSVASGSAWLLKYGMVFQRRASPVGFWVSVSFMSLVAALLTAVAASSPIPGP